MIDYLKSLVAIRDRYVTRGSGSAGGHFIDGQDPYVPGASWNFYDCVRNGYAYIHNMGHLALTEAGKDKLSELESEILDQELTDKSDANENTPQPTSISQPAYLASLSVDEDDHLLLSLIPEDGSEYSLRLPRSQVEELGLFPGRDVTITVTP